LLSVLEIRKQLQQMITHRRYLHSLGVEKMARELAARNNLDPDKTALAGLVHDCGRDLKKDFRSEISDLAEKHSPGEDDALTHAHLGAKLAEVIFGITDPEILSAVEKHTLGGLGMTDFEKVVYLADFIEPGRRFPGLAAIKKATVSSLDEGLLEASKQTIQHLLNKGCPIHPVVVAMRNEILEKQRRGE
jgi:predicted HD superfamily hydrolase involved in NAD metabolism